MFSQCAQKTACSLYLKGWNLASFSQIFFFPNPPGLQCCFWKCWNVRIQSSTGSNSPYSHDMGSASWRSTWKRQFQVLCETKWMKKLGFFFLVFHTRCSTYTSVCISSLSRSLSHSSNPYCVPAACQWWTDRTLLIPRGSLTWFHCCWCCL